jgi:hypothetical protein
MVWRMSADPDHGRVTLQPQQRVGEVPDDVQGIDAAVSDMELVIQRLAEVNGFSTARAAVVVAGIANSLKTEQEAEP